MWRLLVFAGFFFFFYGVVALQKGRIKINKHLEKNAKVECGMIIFT
jgi:hypothetical protein